MNILFWSDGFWPRIGGIESISLRLIEYMQKRGHHYIVIAQKDDPAWEDDETYNSILIKRFDFNAVINKQRLTELRTIENELYQILHDFKPDLVHLNTTLGTSAFIFLIMKKIFKIPIVLTVHAICTYEDKLLPVTEKILLAADQLCSVSHYVLQQIQQYLPQVTTKSTCIYNGLPLPELIPSPLSFNPPVIMCLGRLSPEKRFDLALKAVAQLKEFIPDLHLIIAGDGPERNYLDNLVESLQIRDFITFTGSVALQDVPGLINQATMIVMPSSSESFGLVALEAAQMQRPIIATRVGGLPEVVLDHETGILIPLDDIQALCEAIQGLILNPESAIKMGQNGRQRATKTFTLHTLATEYEKVYDFFYTNKIESIHHVRSSERDHSGI